MTNTAIRVDGLGKRYVIGELESHSALRDAIGEAIRAPIGWLRRGHARRKARSEEHVWALRNATFDVAPGEVVGIIGRNGAGKTTLLKLLSRITQPTEGSADVYGRVGSLLEVGTGFHPDLTGRENVFLNGAILGMRHAEIERKFDEIVEFAGVERFIDTPVKRFSSGMQVRLAFAVAAHFEPDILLVDEVLAVGDHDFQKKCMGRMEDVGARGRTVLFVSHSMPAVLRLCPRVVLLDRGGVVADGPAREVTRAYLESGLGTSAAREWPDMADAPGDDVVRLRSVRVLDHTGHVSEEVDVSRPAEIEVRYRLCQPATGLQTALTFTNEDGVTLFASMDPDPRAGDEAHREPGAIRSVCRIPRGLLAEGQVLVEVVLYSPRPNRFHAVEKDAVAFHAVVRADAGVDERVPLKWPGVVRPLLDWEIDREGAEAVG